MKQRLDQLLHARGLVASRSQAESWIRLGKVFVNGEQVKKAGTFIDDAADLDLQTTEQYVSRAGLKLSSVAQTLHLEFKDKVMLDVGSSTGGFTDYALQHGIRKVIAVDVGTDQLHPTLHGNSKIELHEQTDIRDVMLRVTGVGAAPARRAGNEHQDGAERPAGPASTVEISDVPDLVVIDVSFVSLRDILPHVSRLCGPQTIVAAMVKPQFEARESNLKHKGVIKNDRMRRDILKDFETWVTSSYIIIDKADSDIAGSKGNRERFYKLRPILRPKTAR